MIEAWPSLSRRSSNACFDVKNTGDVDGEDPVPLVEVVVDRFLDLDTGSVHEDVESAVGVAHLGEAGHDSSLVGDVEGKEGAGGRIATDTAAVARSPA